MNQLPPVMIVLFFFFLFFYMAWLGREPIFVSEFHVPTLATPGYGVPPKEGIKAVEISTHAHTARLLAEYGFESSIQHQDVPLKAEPMLVAHDHDGGMRVQVPSTT